MPEANEKMVELDTSGPGAEVELSEDNKPETEAEETHEANSNDSVESNDSAEESSEQSTVQDDSTEPRRKYKGPRTKKERIRRIL
jgi:hypothetical protein